jgi:hypothetical protein
MFLIANPNTHYPLLNTNYHYNFSSFLMKLPYYKYIILSPEYFNI